MGKHLQKGIAILRAYRRRSPRISLKSWFIATLVLVAVAAAITLCVMKRPLWIELEAVAAIVSVLIFVALTAALYTGARVQSRESFEAPSRRDLPEALNLVPIADPISALAAGGDLAAAGGCLEGCMGAGLILLGGVALILLVGILLYAGVFAGAVLLAALFYLFHRGLRVVLVHGKRCRGHLLASIAYGLAYAALGTGWFYSVIYFGHLFADVIRKHAA
jgi:hypothetical protein